MPRLCAALTLFILCWVSNADDETPTDNAHWVPLPEMQHPRDGAVVAAIGTGAFVIGGSNNGSHLVMNGVSIVEKFDLQRHVWELLPPMPTPRSGAAGVAIQDGIFVAGGLLFDLIIGALEIYNTTSNYWTQGPPMLNPRCCMAAVNVDDKMWLIGGGDSNSRGTWVEVYDPTTQTWRSSTPLPDPRAYHAAASDGKMIYVVGGQETFDAKSFILVLNTENEGICPIIMIIADYLPSLLPRFQANPNDNHVVHQIQALR